MSKKNIGLIGLFIIMLIGIPLAVYLAQKPQDTRSRAAKSTVLSFSPTSSQSAPIQKTTGSTFDVDVMIDPGQNTPSFIKLVITYDPAFVATASAGTCGSGFCPNLTSLALIAGPEYGHDNVTGKNTIAANFSIAANSTAQIQSATRIATISFRALAPTTAGTTQIGFNTQAVEVLSTTTTDGTQENVFSSATPAFITISGNAVTGISPTATPSANISPSCTSLNVDRATTGSAPFSIAFTVNGTDTDGTIQQVTLNYGDGPIENLLSGGGIGTKTISLQKSHTYNNPGTYSATAILTDSNGAASAPGGCSQTITVTARPTGSAGAGVPGSGPGAGAPGGPGGIGAPDGDASGGVDTPIEEPAPPAAVEPELKPGPADTILTVGAVGVVLSVIAGILYFAL